MYYKKGVKTWSNYKYSTGWDFRLCRPLAVFTVWLTGFSHNKMYVRFSGQKKKLAVITR